MRNDVGMARFMLAAMPFTGHVIPMLAVADELRERGHSVRVYTGSAFRERVEASGAVFVPWRNAPDFDENDLTKTFPRLIGKKGVRQVMINLTDAFIGTAPAQVKDLLAAWEEEPWDALVTDDTSCGGAFTAEKTDAPWATVAILPLNLPSRHGPPSGLGIAPGLGPLGRARDAALRGIRPLLATPLRKPLARARAEAGLPPSQAIFDEVVFSPQLILASGAPLLDYERPDRPAHLEFIGRLAATPRKDALPDWWPELHDRAVVHVTQGTQNIDPSDLIRPTIEALADWDALVVVATGRRGVDELPFTVPSNVRVSGFLPYDALLSHVDAIVTNGGWGGTLAALAHGIRLVIGGGDLDKPEIAARVAWSGAAVNLKTGTPKPAAIAEAVERVLRERDFADAAARVAAQLESGGGAQRAAQRLEELAGAASAV